ncbi:MAG TPA: hypothetical protein VE291_00065 [Terracidiphilus sp.]|jgi:hypothetical protein|nr:hypothetical protein [Terracidiphilus sp.]
MRTIRGVVFALVAVAVSMLTAHRSPAQAALLMEQPYGFFGAVNPTGHTAIYFEHICAETPVQLRRCRADEMGTVIARYSGIGGYDWIAIPLLPYLYSVENVRQIPYEIDHATVDRLRDKYHEEHLLTLGDTVPRGDFWKGGWTELVGTAYERRVYAFRFNTSAAQDDALIARLNGRGNRSHFNLLFNNCSDFARGVLDEYFPGHFKRSLFPDADVTTPKQIAWKLMRYARKNPSAELTVLEIPQIPGYRRLSHSNKNISESLVTTGYAIPIAVLNPYLAGGLFVDYLMRGRHHLIPKDPALVTPDSMAALTPDLAREQNPDSASTQATRAAADSTADPGAVVPATPGLRETSAEHEQAPAKP